MEMPTNCSRCGKNFREMIEERSSRGIHGGFICLESVITNEAICEECFTPEDEEIHNSILDDLCD